jgi:hypothetical protein
MTMNVALGNTVTFIMEFQDANGNLTQGLGLVFTITQNGATIFTQTLSYAGVIGYFYTAVWNSANASIGYATYAITANGANLAVADPNLRITPPALIL